MPPDGGSITIGTEAESGVLSPAVVVADTMMVYAMPGCRPANSQLAGEEQVTVTAVPTAGVAVNVYDEKGPPFAGGFALRMAVVGRVAWMVEDDKTGALHSSQSIHNPPRREPERRAGR